MAKRPLSWRELNYLRLVVERPRTYAATTRHLGALLAYGLVSSSPVASSDKFGRYYYEATDRGRKKIAEIIELCGEFPQSQPDRREWDDYLAGKLRSSRPRRALRPPLPKIVRDLDVRGIRAGTGLSQADFADRYHIGHDAVRSYESGRTHPSPAVALLLKLIALEPEAVARVLDAE